MTKTFPGVNVFDVLHSFSFLSFHSDVQNRLEFECFILKFRVLISVCTSHWLLYACCCQVGLNFPEITGVLVPSTFVVFLIASSLRRERAQVLTALAV